MYVLRSSLQARSQSVSLGRTFAPYPRAQKVPPLLNREIILSEWALWRGQWYVYGQVGCSVIASGRLGWNWGEGPASHIGDKGNGPGAYIALHRRGQGKGDGDLYGGR